MEQIDKKTIQEKGTPIDKGTKPPWDPKSFALGAFLFSFGAAGILAGLNWRRLGKPQYTFPTIFFSLGGLVFFLLLIIFFSFPTIVCYGINLGIGFLLARLQQEPYKQWVTEHGKPTKRQSGFLIPIVVSLSTLIMIVLFISVILLLQEMDRLHVMVDGSQNLNNTSDYPVERTSADTLESQYSTNAMDHYEKGEFRDAINEFNKVIKIKPDEAAYYFLRGTCYYALYELDNALNDLNRAINLDQNFSEAYQNRGLVYSSLEDWDNALADINRAIHLQTANSALYKTRGLIYAKMEDYDQALHDYNYALTLTPDDDSIYLVRGNLFHEINMIEKAKADFKKAVELNRENLQFLNELKKRFPDFDID